MDAVSVIREMMDDIEDNWVKYPPQYCGEVEAQIQEREKDAKISVLEDLLAILE